MHDPQAHHRPAVPATAVGRRRSRWPAGQIAAQRLHRRRRSAAFFCDYLQDYLTGKLEIPTQDQLDNGGLTIKTTLEPDLQRSSDQGVLQQRAHGRPVRRRPRRRPAGHRARAGDGHQPPVRLQGRRLQSVNYSTWRRATAPGRPTRCSPRPPRSSQGFGAHYTITRRSPTPRRSTRARTERSDEGRPAGRLQRRPGLQGHLRHDLGAGGLDEHLLRRPGGRDRQHRRRSCRPRRPWACTIDRRPRRSPSSPPTRSSRTTAARSPWARRRPARWTWPRLRHGRGERHAAATPTPVTAVLDQNGQPLKDAKGKVYDTGDHCTPNAIAPGRRQHAGQHDGRRRLPGRDRPQGDHPGPRPSAGRPGPRRRTETAAFGGITPELRGGRHVLRPDPTEAKVDGRRRRRRRAGADLPRRDGADPGQPARPPVPAGRPGGRGGHRAPARAPTRSSDNGSSTNGNDAAGGDGGAAAVAPTPAPNPAPVPAPAPAPAPAPVGGNGGGNGS